MVYSNINDFLTDNEIQESNTETKMLLNTNIISFKMDKDEIKSLKELPVELTFQHLTDLTSGNPKCSYWHYEEDTYEGDWRSDGCSVKTTNKTHTVCSCNHLTHFAVLMDIHGVYDRPEIGTRHTYILKILTITLSSISMICILLTLFIFNVLKIFKRSNEKSKDYLRVTVHLCVCLLLSLFAFGMGIFLKDLRIKVDFFFILLNESFWFCLTFILLLFFLRCTVH